MEVLKTHVKKLQKFSEKYLKKLKKTSINYLKSNHLLLAFVVINFIVAWYTRAVTVYDLINISPIIADISVLLFFGSIAFLFKPKARFTYLLIITIILTIIKFVNVVYFGYYASFISVNMLQTLTVNDPADLTGTLFFNVFVWYQFLTLLGPIIFILYYRLVIKPRTKEVRNYKKNRFFKETLIVASCLLIIFLSTLEPRDFSRLANQWNREHIVRKFGIYVYQINDLMRSLEPRLSSLFGYDNALRVYREYFENHDHRLVNNQYTNIFKGKNLLMIHAESIQTTVIGLEFNGQEVAPVHNRLAREGMFFSNFYAQTSVGTSSDAEFLMTTSLMPVSSGTVFVSYSNHEYLSMPRLLQEMGYSTFAMHANNGNFWNRRVMYEGMGYETFYDRESFEIDDIVGLGLSDESFFRQAVPIIAERPQPFFGTVITLSNHTPFTDSAARSDLDLRMRFMNPTTGEYEWSPYLEGTRLGEYYKSVNYADRVFGEFLDQLDEAGLLDNTVIVIYGDHDARLPRADYIKQFNYDPITGGILDRDNPNFTPYESWQHELNRNVPFIIWTKDRELQAKINREVTTVTGMLDALPILGNMFGFESPYQLGRDTTVLDNHFVPFPNGNWISNTGYFRKNQGNTILEGFIPFTQRAIDEEYIYNFTYLTERKIEVSNAIIMHNLKYRAPMERVIRR